MSKIMNKEVAIARLRDLGFNYVGADSARELFNAVDAPPRRPEPIMEPMPPDIAGRNHSHLLVDRYDGNPAVSFTKLLFPGGRFTTPVPEMFISGATPLFTASGVDPAMLWFIPWVLRHSAASTPHRELVLAMAEEGDGDTDALQTRGGRAMLDQYLIRVRNWSVIRPTDDEPSEDQINALFAPWKPLGD